MNPGEHEFPDQTATLIWSQAGVQRELATAMAVRDLRLRRMRSARMTMVCAGVMVFVCGGAAGWALASWKVAGPNSLPQIEQAQLTASEPLPPSSASATTPPEVAVQDQAATPVEVHERPVSADAAPPPLQLQDPRPETKTLKTAKSSPPAPKTPSESKLGLEELQPLKSEKSKTRSSNGHYEAPSQDQGTVAAKGKSKSPSANATDAGFKLAGVPVDGIALIQIEGGPVKAFKLGDKLPDGSIIQSANSATGEIQTSRSQVKK